MFIKHKKITFSLVGAVLLAALCLFWASYPLKNSKHVIIVGSNGSGKTTTALYLLGKNLKHTDGHIDLTDTNDPHHGRIGTRSKPLQCYHAEKDDLTYCEFSERELETHDNIYSLHNDPATFKRNKEIRRYGRKHGTKALVFTLESSSDYRDAIALLQVMFPTLDTNQEEIMPAVFFVFTKTDDTTSDLLNSLKTHKKETEHYITRFTHDREGNEIQVLPEELKRGLKRLKFEIDVCNYILESEAYQQSNIIHLNDPTKQDQTLLKKIKQAKPISSRLFGGRIPRFW